MTFYDAITIDKAAKRLKIQRGSTLARCTIKGENKMEEDSLIFRFIESLKYMKKVFENQTEKELRCVVVNRAEYPLYVRGYASISKRATF